MDKKTIAASLDTTPVLISQAENGDSEAAKVLLIRAARYLSEGSPLPDRLATYVTEGLLMLADDATPHQAFHIKKTKGRRTDSRELRRQIGEAVEVSNGGLHKFDGGAYHEVGKKFNVSPNTVEKYYKQYLEEKYQEETINQQIRDDNERES